MSFPLINILAVALGALMAALGAILLWVAAFRESLVWGLVTVLAPLGKISFACRRWAEARTCRNTTAGR